MGTNDSSNPAQCPLELVEILKRLGAHSRELHAQVFGKPLWTREQSDGYWHHPLVWACKWLEERVGISRHELEHAAFRLTTPHGLKGMDPLPGPDEDFLTALEGNAKRELCELYDLMAADKTPPELKGQGKPVQLTEKQQAALAGLRPNCFQVISEEQAEALAQLPGRAIEPRRPTEGDPGMPDWLWMTGKFRELDRDGTTDRDSTTTRLWRQLSEEYATILVAAGIPVASQPLVVVPVDSVVAKDETKILNDGLSPDGLTLRWGGILYPLPSTTARFVKLLVDAFENGFPYLHEEYLKAEGEFESDVRHLVRDGLESIVVREVGNNGKVIKGKWGLIDPKKVLVPQ